MLSTNMKNYTLVVVALLVGIGLGYIGYGAFHRSNLAGATSAVGTSFSSAKAYSVSFVPATRTATSTSILNTDATDRYVIGTEIGCQGVGTSKTAYTGAGLASLTLTVGTSSTANPTSLNSWASVGTITIATATPVFFYASSTLATATSSWATIWPTGSYMTFITNATNTAACTVGVRTLAS